MGKAQKICVIPDTQVRPGISLDHFSWIGRYIAEKRPDTIVHLGDHWEFDSLSEYDRDTKVKEFSQRSYAADLDSGHAAIRLLNAEILAVKGYKPRMEWTEGNHDQRVMRLLGREPRLVGAFPTPRQIMHSEGWHVNEYLKPVTIAGVTFCHLFVKSSSGLVTSTKFGAPNAKAMIQREMRSCTAGHKPGLDTHIQSVGNRQIRGIIAGSCLQSDHKVLTADLRYVPLRTLNVGDKLVSFDEKAPSRKRRFKTGIVEALAFESDELFAVTLVSGKVFRVTRDHQWLVKRGSLYEWRRTDSLQCGIEKRNGTKLPILLSEWESLTSNDAGWLAGLYDGEGSLYARQQQTDSVVSIKPVGSGTVCRIAIDAKTMVVEGYGHHNCYRHDLEYGTPQGNRHWRGILVKHEVRHGDYSLMEVSLDFLKRKYS